MEYTTFKNQWRITRGENEVQDNLLRAQNETNRLLAAIGTLLEGQNDSPSTTVNNMPRVAGSGGTQD